MRAPDQLARAWQLDWSAAIAQLRAADSLFVVGRGLGLGIAQEAALKLKETCGLHAEAFSAAEVRHGPSHSCGRGFPVLAFAQHDETRSDVEALATELNRLGARVSWSRGPKFLEYSRFQRFARIPRSSRCC